MSADTLQFNFGDIVIHKTDEDEMGIVTGILYRPDGGIKYLVTWQNRMEEQHYEIELYKCKLNLKET